MLIDSKSETEKRTQFKQTNENRIRYSGGEAISQVAS